MIPAIIPFTRHFLKQSFPLKLFSNLLGILVLYALVIPLHLVAQATMPPVISFTKNDYNAARQNWNIAQDQEGIMYFANNDGLLQFDGNSWQLFRMRDQLGLRSVAIDSNGRIYTGTYQEFGYWEPSPDGMLHYTSLSKALKGYQFNNDEIWKIVILGRQVYFQSFGTYFVYDGKTVVKRNTPEAIMFFLRVGDGIITQGMQSGLFAMEDDSLKFLTGSEVLRNAAIRAAIRLDSVNILLGTSSQGLYIFNTGDNSYKRWYTDADDLLMEGQINCGVMSDDSILCFGTIGKGIIALSKNGRLFWNLNKENSLSTNTVLHLYRDLQNNIWAALDQGMALIRLNSPFQYVTEASGNIELAYTAIVFDNALYVGTNQGVFRSDFNTGGTFDLIAGTQGQVWQLVDFDHQLLCGHNEGTFRIEGTQAIPISAATGGTALRHIMSAGKEYLLQGTYGSLAIFARDPEGKWRFRNSIRGFSQPVRYLEIDHLGNVWAAHFIKGLYRIKLNLELTEVAEIRTFGSNEGLPAEYKLSIAKVGGRVVICTGSEFYTYDDLKNQLIPYSWLNRQAGEFAASHIIIPAGDNRYWLVKKEKCALAELGNDSLFIRDILPFSLLKNNLIDENENITPIGDDMYLFCLDNGLAVYERALAPMPASYNPHVLIRKIRASSNKSTLNLPLESDPRSKPVIPYYFRRIMFTFAYPDYSGNQVSLRYKLTGNRETITDTVSGQLVTYAYLEAGQYELKVVAVDETNKVLGTASYYFGVLPPFYARWYAWLTYLFLLMIAGWFGWRGIRLHVNSQNEKVKLEQIKLQQERIERREQKITLLKNEKLEAELRHKSKELASSTMAIIRKNEMLLHLRKEVEMQKQKLGSQYPNKYADHLMRLINENISSDDDWEIFQQNFDLIHENFFRLLKSGHPDITAHDLKLCAFIRLNLSTKEIASLLNITVRGVEAGRYRLRKKFGIPPEKNLTEFLIEVR